MHEYVQYPSGMKNEKIVYLYPSRYILMFFVFLDGYNS